jgi:hypothetical protein
LLTVFEGTLCVASLGKRPMSGPTAGRNEFSIRRAYREAWAAWRRDFWGWTRVMVVADLTFGGGALAFSVLLVWLGDLVKGPDGTLGTIGGGVIALLSLVYALSLISGIYVLRRGHGRLALACLAGGRPHLAELYEMKGMRPYFFTMFRPVMDLLPARELAEFVQIDRGVGSREALRAGMELRRLGPRKLSDFSHSAGMIQMLPLALVSFAAIPLLPRSGDPGGGFYLTLGLACGVATLHWPFVSLAWASAYQQLRGATFHPESHSLQS